MAMLLPGARSPIASTPNPLKPTTATSTSEETKGLWLGTPRSSDLLLDHAHDPNGRWWGGRPSVVSGIRNGRPCGPGCASGCGLSLGIECRTTVPRACARNGGFRLWDGGGLSTVSCAALKRVDAVHASVITGILPLATAVVAAIVFRQKPSWGFWACGLLGYPKKQP